MPDVVLLTTEGFHVPVIPFIDIVGRTGAVLPEQIGAILLNVGVMLEVILTVNVAVVPHCPGSGVNV